MGTIQKIPFPYLIDHNSKLSNKPHVVIFFSTDFFNLPADSNRNLFIERTNQALEYIRTQFPGRTLLYQVHPNEHDERKYLDLTGFTIGEPTIAEVLLLERSEEIEYVFSINSWASASAYLMGLQAAVLFDAFTGALSEETMKGTRGYYAGFPNSFFIRSFDSLAPKQEFSVSQKIERASLSVIAQAVGKPTTVWVVANEPSTALRAAIIIRHLRQRGLTARANLIQLEHRRWKLIIPRDGIFSVFDEWYTVPYVWYSAQPRTIFKAFRTASAIRKLSIKPKDVLISSAHPYFHENCLLSYHQGVRKILFMENRFYHFIYGGGADALSQNEFHTPFGARLFNLVLEPLLGLYRTVYRQYADGRVLNIHRYRLSLENIYSSVFVFRSSIACRE